MGEFGAGLPVGLVCGACDSGSWVCKFEPYIEYRDNVQKNEVFKNRIK